MSTTLSEQLPQPTVAPRVVKPRPRVLLHEPVARRNPSVEFSFAGLIYSATMLFMGLAAINSQANLLFIVFGLMIGILLVSGAICQIVLRKIDVTRALPEHAAVGQPAVIQYTITNRKRYWPNFSIVVSELDSVTAFSRQPHAYLLHTAARQTAVITCEVLPRRRGIYPLNEFQLTTGFPFGFVRRSIEGSQFERLLIYPAIGSVSPRLIALCRSADRSGMRVKPSVNGNDEFFGVKDFRAGENPRLIHWKRSARTGELVSKEMAQIAPPNLLIVLDTYLAADDRSLASLELLERAIAMAASVATVAMESGMAVGLCLWHDGWKTFEPQRGKRHCREILAELATVSVDDVFRINDLIDQAQRIGESRTTLVLFSAHASIKSSSSRNRVLSLAADSSESRQWFEFDPKIDFVGVAPSSQAISQIDPSAEAGAP